MPDGSVAQGAGGFVRRDFGLATLGLAFQTPSPTQPPSTLDLSRNLFTRLSVRVRVNGQGPFVFVLDTGTQRTALSDRLVAQLGLAPSHPVVIHGVTTATRVETVAVDLLTVGVERFRDLRSPVLPQSNLAAEGLIGLDVLSHFRLGFDTPRRQATLDRGAFVVIHGPTADTGSLIRRSTSRAVRQKAGQIVLTDSIADGVNVAAFIDTGAQFSIGNLAMRERIGRNLHEERKLGDDIQVFGVTGDSLHASPGHIDRLRLGRQQLLSVPILFADMHCFRVLELHDAPAMLIGADLIGRFSSVMIDFPGARIRFDDPIRA